MINSGSQPVSLVPKTDVWSVQKQKMQLTISSYILLSWSKAMCLLKLNLGPEPNKWRTTSLDSNPNVFAATKG